jgi:hypothetical protein
MKKRLLLTSLTLALLLMTLSPVSALAASRPRVSTGDFTGSGQLFVTYMPDPTVKGPIWRYHGEVALGYLDQCDWGLLAGASFYTVHNSLVNVDREGNARGVMQGSFIITGPDGQSTLTGTFFGRIRGNLNKLVIMDQGTWIGTEGTGVFEDVKAWGKWSASLNAGTINGQLTLLGPLIWQGRYISCNR